jgi:1-aminocyclopropane-1-carboxylate deaminase/D-cysteine desulfhydrase-like pyridoxal-dependent ACC family enzyme
MEEMVAEERSAGHAPYPIPLGGSNALGAAGYALAMMELKSQMETQHLSFDRIVFASSSGGTQAGLVVGKQLTGFAGEVLGISIDHRAETLKSTVAALAAEVAALAEQPQSYPPANIAVNADYLGAGYGQMGQPEREAIELFAKTEGILLDPVYTGRAAAGLIDMIRSGVIHKKETVLFWHTGGLPALWAYTEKLVP